MVKPKSKVRKIDSDRSAPATALHTDGSNKLADSVNTGSGAASSSNATPPPPPSAVHSSETGSEWLTDEIRKMMFAFGDCPWPLQESVSLVETILRQQMSLLVNMAAEVAVTRGSGSIGVEELLFIVKRHKPALNRFVTYLAQKDFIETTVKSSVSDSRMNTDDSDVGSMSAVVAAAGSGVKSNTTLSRRRLCLDFLENIDQTGELISSLNQDDGLDDIKRERLQRADRQSKQLDVSEFLAFSEARRASFCGGKNRAKKFKEWICEGLSGENFPDIVPNVIGMEGFNYLAQETVAHMVELALLVKNDSASYDPALRGMHRSSISERRGWTSSDFPHTGIPSSSSLAIAEEQPRTNLSGPRVNVETSNAIQSSEITEAMRRCHYNFGSMTPFAKLHGTPFARTLLFC